MSGHDRLPFQPPFFYGWVILACVGCASFARQGAAVATLSVFIVPMTLEFDWSRTAISGAVSLGGVLGAVIAPLVGPWVDRAGSRAVLTLSALAIGGAAFALAGIESLLAFYIAFAFGRMVFSTPFEIGTAAAVANWFVARRGLAMAVLAVSIGVSLAIMPMLAQLVTGAFDWRAGWIAVGVSVVVVGAVPNAWLMRRRPEDVGLRPDGAPEPDPAARDTSAAAREIQFTRAEALRTPAFWILTAFIGLIFPVQAGLSLHQAPLMIERGLDSLTAAAIVSTFSLAVAAASVVFGSLADRLPVRFGLAAAAALCALGAMLMHGVETAADGYFAATVYGAGIGGLLTLQSLAYANYFGRSSFGAIRGISVPVQVLGQAAGPLIAGAGHDLTGSYDFTIWLFAGFALTATVLVLFARPPPAPS